jgi:hypothetical protein
MLKRLKSPSVGQAAGHHHPPPTLPGSSGRVINELQRPRTEQLWLFTVVIEVCDGSIDYVEDRLDEACDRSCQGCMWCPWSSRFTREVT